MTGLIIQTEKDLDLWVAEFIQNSKGFLNTVDTKVAKIIKDVRNRGDKAIIELSRKFDNIDLKESNFYFTDAEITKAELEVSRKEREAIEKY